MSSNEPLTHQNDWLLALVSMLASTASGVRNREGARIGDALAVLNVSIAQLEQTLRMVALHRDASIAVSKPAGGAACDSESMRTYPCKKTGWANEPGKEKGISLLEMVRLELGDACVDSIENCFIFLDLGFDAPQARKGAGKTVLIPMNLRDVGCITLREKTNVVPIERSQQYGRSLPTAREEANVDCFMNAHEEHVGVWVCSNKSSGIEELYSAAPLRLYPRDSRNRRLATVMRGNDEIVLDLAGPIEPQATAIVLKRDNSRAIPPTANEEEADCAEIDYWDMPPDGLRPVEGCQGSYEGVPHLITETLCLRFDNHRNTIARARHQFDSRPGSYEERDGAAFYEAAIVYSTGELQRFILSFGSNCTVISPECLRRWHIQGTMDRLERFANLL